MDIMMFMELCFYIIVCISTYIYYLYLGLSLFLLNVSTFLDFLVKIRSGNVTKTRIKGRENTCHITSLQDLAVLFKVSRIRWGLLSSKYATFSNFMSVLFLHPAYPSQCPDPFKPVCQSSNFQDSVQALDLVIENHLPPMQHNHKDIALSSIRHTSK